MIKKSFFYILTVPFVFLLQIFFTRALSIGGIFPNLFLLVTAFLGLRFGSLKGTCVGFTLGLLADGITVSLFGSQAFALTLVGYFVGTLKGKIDEERPLAQIGMTLVLSLVYAGILYLLEILFGEAVRRYDWSTSIYQSFYTAAMAPVAFASLILWRHLFEN